MKLTRQCLHGHCERTGHYRPELQPGISYEELEKGELRGGVVVHKKNNDIQRYSLAEPGMKDRVGSLWTVEFAEDESNLASA
jgi:hypothetical protein